MNTTDLKNILIPIARSKIITDDPSHDFNHALRVLVNAEEISKHENADLEVIIPSAIFHDIVTYPKNDPRSKNAQVESALISQEILKDIKSYPKEKVKEVLNAIELCSFSKGIVPDQIEAKILQDSDGLEATGAISIMRTFCSTGIMNRPFYNSEDPFCTQRSPDDMSYAVDLFFTRLMKVKERMHTEYAKKIAERRIDFLNKFLEEFKLELAGQ